MEFTAVQGGDRILSRFDTAHGIAHHDLLTEHGNLREKRWMADLTFNQALDYAVNHFKADHEDDPG